MRRRPLVLCILAVVAMALVAVQHGNSSSPTGGVMAPPAVGLLGETLRRCRDLGPSALADDDCRAAWAQSRQMFLFPARQPTRGAP